MYYVIYNSEDGVRITKHTKEDLEEKLNERYWGPDVKTLCALPSEPNPDYWDNGSNTTLVIIEGMCVVPHEVKTVTELKLP